MIVSTKIAGMFKDCGFVNIDSLIDNKLERNPSKILNILNRDWRKRVKPLSMFDGGGLDPNFGYETAGGSTSSIVNIIRGSWFTCPESGTADSISPYVVGGTSVHMKCAIYKKSDNSLVGVTGTRTLSAIPNWRPVTFADPKPNLTNIDYWLVAWSDGAGGTTTKIYYNAEAGKGGYQNINYDSFPNPWSPTVEDNKCSIYCTYTVAGAAAKAKLILLGHKPHTLWGSVHPKLRQR